MNKQELSVSLANCYKNLETLLQEIKKDEKEIEGWKFHSQDSNWKLYTGKGTTTLLTGIINASPKIVLSYFEEFEKYPEYDTFFDSGEIVQDITKDHPEYQMTCLCYIKYKGFWPVFSARDFSCVCGHTQLKDGTYLSASYSIETDLIPVSSQFIRGTIEFPSGTIIEELEEGKCRVTSVIEICMGGWLSSSVMSLMVSESIPTMKRCSNACEKAYLESKK